MERPWSDAMFRKALAINEKFGRLEGMANQCANLGLLQEMRGDTNQARALWEKSRELYGRIGIPDMAKKVQDWIDALPPANND